MTISLQRGGMTMNVLELLQHIVNEPAPRLTPEGRFSKEAEEFVANCLDYLLVSVWRHFCDALAYALFVYNRNTPG